MDIQNPKSKIFRCFVIAPFDNFRLKDAIKRSLNEISVEVITADEFSSSSSIVNNIIQTIENSDFVIADITRKNPNVMYEIGFAHALRKPTLIITDKENKEPLPTNLSGWLYIIYDQNNFRSLQTSIVRSISNIISKQRNEGANNE